MRYMFAQLGLKTLVKEGNLNMLNRKAALISAKNAEIKANRTNSLLFDSQYASVCQQSETSRTLNRTPACFYENDNCLMPFSRRKSTSFASSI